MNVRFLGAAGTVTGSCSHLSAGGLQLLVDCGLHQGPGADEANRTPFAFPPPALDVVFLTHAHIDHSGLLPRLVREGFRGRILATAATADLVEVMLRDSAQIQEKDAEWLTRRAQRAGDETRREPLYTPADAEAVVPLVRRQPYGQVTPLGGGLECRFLDAGHILGSASLELWYPHQRGKRKMVFSGDVGKRDNPIVRNPQTVDAADYVVVESTYGDRLHKGLAESIDELAEAVRDTVARGGNVLIPSFAVGRTQDVVYLLNRLVREGRLPRFDLYVDSPLAQEATRVYLAHPEAFDEEAQALLRRRTTRGLRLHFTTTVRQSQALNRVRSGAVILAGSGMCEGGRIGHHLKHNLWRPECSVIFVGYQAEGTLGRKIVEGAPLVQILGEDIAVRAEVHTIGGFSAHADREELLDWLDAFTTSPEVFLVHGEPRAAAALEDAIRRRLGLVTQRPERGQAFEV
ncbi:MAG: MBL fold metallo-hydrolase [Deferrisomatales bacterium]|nr:MBL fold metallo-hydrolase [Deferrisomatales bacterium]